MKRTTKYFGEVEPIIDRYRGIAELEVTYNGQHVRLALWALSNAPRSGVDDKNQHSVAHNKRNKDEKKREDFSPSSAPGENLEKNLPFFWEVVDKYAELYQAANKAIVEYYDKDEDEYYAIKNFFYELFTYKDEEALIEVFGEKDFEKFDIKAFVDKMPYPRLTIYPEYNMEVYL